MLLTLLASQPHSPCNILKPPVNPILDALRNAQCAPCPSVFLFFASEYEHARLVYEQANWRFKRRKPRLQCVRRPENESAGHQRMQPKTFPESQNHGDWRESKLRRPFFRSLLGEIPVRGAGGTVLEAGEPEVVRRVP